jgi:predicted Zn-dependent protease
VGRHLVSVLPNKYFDYRFYVVKDSTFNAFAAPAGHVFVNSGLLEAMDSEQELAGIIGHEIAHVECRHISQKIERSSKINMLTLAGMAAGIFLGIGGADTAAQALTMGSMAAGESLSLAYSREDESQADQVGLKYLYQAGYGAEGLVTMLRKIRSTEWFGSYVIPKYLNPQPDSEDRIAYIANYILSHPSPEKNAPTRDDEFDMSVTRLIAEYGDENAALNRFNAVLEKEPENPRANYGVGVVHGRSGNRKTAQEYLKTALKAWPRNPYVLSDLGRIYFLSGQYADALPVLKDAVREIDDNDQALFYLGRTELELGEYDKAVEALEKLVQKKENFYQGHYFLGEAYGRMENLGDAHYHLGIYSMGKRDAKTAMVHFELAEKKLADPVKLKKIKKMKEEIRLEGRKHPGEE